MEPIIYKLLPCITTDMQACEVPTSDNPISLNDSDIYFDTNPSPKLIKYGFNNMVDQLDLMAITSISYYRAGLNFDFTRTGKNSIAAKFSKIFGTKNVDETFAEFWEIITLFNLFNTNTDVLTSHPDTMADIIKAYTSFSKTKNKFGFVSKKGKANLVIHKYSDIDIDENAAIQFIITDLPNLLSDQTKTASMILQIFGTLTQTMAELIYYLATLYEESYLVKPSVISEIFDAKYLVLLRLKDKTEFQLPKHSKDVYLASIGVNIPDDVVTSIQCMNAETMPAKYRKYYEIKSYLDTRVYEGATYQEMLQQQDDYGEEWIETYTDLSKPPAILANVLKKSDAKCMRRSQLINLLK